MLKKELRLVNGFVEIGKIGRYNLSLHESKVLCLETDDSNDNVCTLIGKEQIDQLYMALKNVYDTGLIDREPRRHKRKMLLSN